MSVRANWNFHTESVATGNGNEYKIANVGDTTIITISISGTALTRTVVFEAKGLVGNYISWNAYNGKNNVVASTTSGTSDEIWLMDVTGLDSIRCRISAIADGNLSISGKVVG